MKKQTTILILLLLFGLFPAIASATFHTIEVKKEVDAACPCNCDKDNDLQILRDIYNNNGGANWVLPSNAIYQDFLDDSILKNVPNAGVTWDINAPNAKNKMGEWHGVVTNQFGCVTDLILWIGPYNVNSPFNFVPQGIGLTGSLPQSIGGLCALERLMAPHNDLSGTIPPSIEDLCSLEVLLLHNNQLSGSIPPEIGNLTNLLHLGLHYNDLSGTLPNTITNLINLVILHLKSNKLSGSIPTDIGNLQKILLTDLSDNCFSGTVPSSIVNLGRNSLNGGNFIGQTIALWLQNNKLDSLPDISALQVINTGIVDVSGNHLTFDDIIPSIDVLTDYDNQTLDLDQFYCAQVGDSIVLRPGFDATVDAGFLGGLNSYSWSRPGTSYQATSDLNFIFFTGVTTLSAGNFSIEVTNPAAPDLTLEVFNLELEVVEAAAIFGTTNVCANTTESYSIFNNSVGYDFVVEGGTVITSDSTNITIQWDNTTSGQICATNRGTCSQTTCVDINISPTIDLAISPPDTLNCSRRVDTLQGNSSFPNLSFSWLTTQGVISDGPSSIEVNTPGNYILEATDEIGCTARDTVFVFEQLDNFQVNITGTNTICENNATTLQVSPNFQSYVWSNGATASAIQVNTPGQYQVTVTNNSDCTATSSFTIQTTAPPLATITKSGDLDCSNEVVQLFNSNVNNLIVSEWRNTNGDLLGNGNIVTVVDPGTYTLIVTDQNGCSSSDQIEVIKDESVVIPAINGTTSLCEGGLGQLSVDENYASYVWSTGATTPSILITDDLLSYSVTVTDVTGCSGSNTITIQQRAKPVVSIGGQLDFCEGNNTELLVDNTFASYTWSNGATTFNNLVNTAGVYSVTVTDADNCSNVASVEVIERPPFLVDIVGETTFCEGTSISLLATQIDNVTYEWSTGDTSKFIFANTSGTYSLTITDGRNCSSTASTTITELEVPLVNISGETTLCENGTSIIQVNEAYPNYSWSNGASSQSITINTTEDAYTVTVTDASGCSNSASIEVEKAPYLTPEIIGNQALCGNGAISLSSSNNYASYQWSNGGNTKDVSVNTAGTYTLTVTSNDGCTGETSVEVATANSPIPQIIGNPSICAGTATSLTTQTDYQSYVWSTGETTETIAANSAGTFLVTVTNAAGCTGTTSFIISEAPDIEFNIVGNTAICEGSSTQLQADREYLTYRWNTGADSSNIVVSQVGTYSLTVTDQSGCTGATSIEVTENSSIFPQIIGIPTLCGNTSTEISTDADYASYSWSNGATSKSIIINSPDTYRVTVSNAAGCTGETVIAIDETPALQPNIIGSLSFCEGQTTTLSLDLPYSSYLWTGDIVRSSIEVSEAGVYAVTVIDENGCTGSTTVEVTQGALSPPIISPENPAICEGDFVSLQVEQGFTNYIWSDGKVGSSNFTSTADLYAVTVTDENGCTGVNEIEVRSLPVPNINEEDPRNRCSGDSSELVRLSLFGFDTYEWETGDTTAEIFVNSGGKYPLTVTNSDGCTSSTTYQVIDLPSPRLTVVNSSGLPGLDTIGCESDKLVLAEIANNVQQYRWENETGDFLGNLPILEVSKAGTYTLIGTDKVTGCEAVMEIPVVQAENTVEVRAKDSLLLLDCNTRKVTLDVSNSTNADTYEWKYTNSDGLSRTFPNNSNTLTADSLGVGEYLVVGIDAKFGCRDTAFVEVVDNSYDILISIEGPTELCENETGQLRVNGSFEEYSWTGGGSSQQINISEARYYEVRVTDENGCKGVEGVNVRMKPLTELEIALQIDQPDICEGSEAEIDFIVQNNSGIGPFNLVLMDGDKEVPFTNISNNQELTVEPTSTSKYELIEIEDLGNSCSFFNGISNEVAFTLKPIPTANVAGDISCLDQNLSNATFNLESLEEAVKSTSTGFVEWYRDSMNTNPIATPSLSISSNTTIYARVSNGPCFSKPAAVNLMVGDCSTNLDFDLEIGRDLDLSDLPGEKRSVYITNRWGDLVYASENYEGLGTTKFNGANLPQGAYYIYIKNVERMDDLPVPYKGIIYLLK